jgi:hypothetical protein
MSATIQRSVARQVATPQKTTPRVTPSKVDPATAKPFTLDQEIEEFGSWVSESILVPPKDASTEMAETMLRQSGLFVPRDKSWSAVVEEHRGSFTQVREIELAKASIRLPKGRFFVSVLEQDRFDQIKDTVPACVQTRLEEFLSGPGSRRGVKVYYLKPLCVEVGDDLFLTSRKDLMRAIEKIQEEVFDEYHRLYLRRRPKYVMTRAINTGLAVPRAFVNYFVQRRQKAIDAYQARLEFKRRKTALRAARAHGRFRTDGCTFDDMLALTNPLQREDVVGQYSIEQNLSRAKRKQLIQMAAGTVPWFVSLAVTASWIAKISLTVTPPVLVCDPVFVAEMPDAPGKLLKIGHFDEVGGVMHVEI